MKKSTTALTLAALIAASGIYYTSTRLTSAFAAEPDQPADAAAYTTAPASDAVFTAVPGTSPAATPLADLAPVTVEDKRDIRCFYRADLTSEYQIEGSSGTPRPPYMGTGIEEVGFDGKTNPTPEDPSSGLSQVTDPINQCSRVWDSGDMILNGINLIEEHDETCAISIPRCEDD